MSRTPIDPKLVHTAESIAKARDLRNRLFALVPKDVCEEAVREDMATVRAPNPDELKELIEAGKRQVREMYAALSPEELPPDDEKIIDEDIDKLFTPPELSPEERDANIAKAVADEAGTIADSLVTSLCNVLYFVRSECKHNNPIRLNDRLLPLGRDALLSKLSLSDWFGYYVRLLQNRLEDDGIKKVSDAFIARVREEVDKTPDGLEVYEGVVIRKDADGYYLTPRI